MGVVAGLKYSEQGLSRGKRARSSSKTAAPPRARRRAVVAPAGPPPTTIASHRVTLVSLVPRSERGDGRSDQRRGQVHAVVVEPSPASGESYRLVTHPVSTLEPRVARRALVLRLYRRFEQRVAQHSGDAWGRDERGCPRGGAPGSLQLVQWRNHRSPGDAANR